jgi:hypothetical protein
VAQSMSGDSGERGVLLLASSDGAGQPRHRKILSRRPDGLWAHADCLILTTRQSGKSQILILRILFGLFVLNERIVFSAQRWVTAEAVFKRLKAIIESRPSLQRRLAKDPTSSSSRAVIELKSGASVALGVRSGDLGRGMDAVDLVVYDESYDLTEAEVAALTGAQLSSPNAQTIYASTPAVWGKHANCQVLLDLRRLSQQRQPDLYFAEWSAPKDAPRDDPETWRIASPSFGVIQKERDVRRMLAKATTPTARALFDADVLGWGDWPPDESETGTVISAETWAAMASTAPELVGPIAVAVDRSQDRKTWAIASAQRTVEGRTHLECSPYQHFSTNADVVEKLIGIMIAWDPISITIDQRSAAGVLKPTLEAAEVESHMTSTAEMVLASGAFLDAVEAGTLSHSNQQTLNDGVVSAVKRDLAGGFAWDRAPGVTQLVAASLAHWSLISATTTAPKRSLPPLSAGSRDMKDEPVWLDMDRCPFSRTGATKTTQERGIPYAQLHDRERRLRQRQADRLPPVHRCHGRPSGREVVRHRPEQRPRNNGHRRRVGHRLPEHCLPPASGSSRRAMSTLRAPHENLYRRPASDYACAVRRR